MALDSLNPAMWAQRTRQYSALRFLMHENGKVPTEVLARAAKAGGFEVDEFKHLLHDWRKSGLMDTVATNADLDAIKNGFHLDKGAFARLASKSLFFYREGESFTRGYAFLTTREAYLKANKLPKGAKLTDKQLIEVVEMATDRMLNLNRANRAAWQKGVISIPTQFWQVTTKFLEAMLHPNTKRRGSFTAGQRTKIAVGQLGLYGAAGVPFGTMLVNNIMEANDIGPQDVSEGWKASIENGLGGFLTEWMFDEAVSIGQRGAYASQVEQVAKDLLREQMSVAKFVGGAGGHVAGRALNALNQLSPMILDPELTFSPVQHQLALTGLTDIISTFSNAHKAWIWWEHRKIVDKMGRAVLTEDEVDNFDALWLYKAVGFQNEATNDVYEAAAFARNVSKFKSEAKEGVKTILHQFFHRIGGGQLSPEEQQDLSARFNLFMRSYPEPMQREIMQEAIDEFMDKTSDSKLNQNYRKAIDKWLDSGITSKGTAGLGLTNIVSESDNE
jgi:hypothetical protein